MVALCGAKRSFILCPLPFIGAGLVCGKKEGRMNETRRRGGVVLGIPDDQPAME